MLAVISKCMLAVKHSFKKSSSFKLVGCMSRSVIDCKLFSILTSTLRGPSAIAELLVYPDIDVNNRYPDIG